MGIAIGAIVVTFGIAGWAVWYNEKDSKTKTKW